MFFNQMLRAERRVISAVTWDRRLRFKIPWLWCSYWFIYSIKNVKVLFCFNNKNTFRHSNITGNDNKSKMIYVIKRTFTMIECWCISIIFGNDLLVKLDNWFSEPFLGNIASEEGREKGGIIGKVLAVSCNAMNVWLFCSKQQRSSCPL